MHIKSTGTMRKLSGGVVSTLSTVVSPSASWRIIQEKKYSDMHIHHTKIQYQVKRVV